MVKMERMHRTASAREGGIGPGTGGGAEYSRAGDDHSPFITQVREAIRANQVKALSQVTAEDKQYPGVARSMIPTQENGAAQPNQKKEDAGAHKDQLYHH